MCCEILAAILFLQVSLIAMGEQGTAAKSSSSDLSTPVVASQLVHISLDADLPPTSVGTCLVKCAVDAFRRQEAEILLSSACTESCISMQSEVRVSLSNREMAVDSQIGEGNGCRLSLWKLLNNRSLVMMFSHWKQGSGVCDEVEQGLRASALLLLSMNVPGHQAEVLDATAPHYPPLEEVEARLQAVADRYGPQLVRPFALPYNTFEGRVIRGVCIGGRSGFGLAQDVNPTPSPAVSVLIVGTHHAREWISAVVTLSLIEQVADALFADVSSSATNASSSLQWKALQWASALSSPDDAAGLELCAIPVLNPDGYAYTFAGGKDDTGSEKRYWRKNRRPCGEAEVKRGTQAANIGTDLNRNYAVDWNDNGGSSPYCDSDTYRGPGPYSEPEVAGLLQWLLDQEKARKPLLAADLPQRAGYTSIRPELRNWTWLDAFISFHSFGNDILYPLGYSTRVFGSNEPLLSSIGGLMKNGIKRETGVDYDVMKAAASYPVSGDTVDDIHLSFGAIPAYTVETRPSAFACCGFVLSPDQIGPTVAENSAALRELVTYVLAAKSAKKVAVGWTAHSFNLTLYESMKSARERIASEWPSCPSLVGLVNVENTDRRSDSPDLHSFRPSHASFSARESFVMEASLPLWGASMLNAVAARQFLLDTINLGISEDELSGDAAEGIDVKILAVIPILSTESLRTVFQLVRSGIAKERSDWQCDMERIVEWIIISVPDIDFVIFSMSETARLVTRARG